ncbi:hypothetical protein [Nostoc favosum]|uniref:Uncharacterized protein n=1 Tax=Nostoc favosum CHAB5714 TaxID=2780399 RepID=A0ABS8IC10_9NOSO|nr:hypothetical protein [Nostoc favosum]MCC5601414.1 hypothetical protein [Nostoc favosum CHAB5714]
MGSGGRGAGEENISLSPSSPSSPSSPLSPSSPSSPGNSKSPEQLSIMFPIQPSGLSILDKFKQPHSFGRMLHRNETSKNPLTFI